MSMCDHGSMSKKPPSRGKSSTRKPAAGTSGTSGRKSATKRPAWLPENLQHGPPLKGGKAPQTAAPSRGARPGAPAPFHDPHAEREANRYAQPIASREVILQLLESADGPQPGETIAELLHLTEPDRSEALAKRLGAMVRDGQLLRNRKGEYAPAQRMDLVPGVGIANPDGFGFLRPEAGGDDLFLPPFEMRKAMHGDRVLASVIGVDRRGR